MITMAFYNMEHKDKGGCVIRTNYIQWKDENSAKAFMFDLLMNYEHEYSYISIEEWCEDEYMIFYKMNHSTARGGEIECFYN